MDSVRQDQDKPSLADGLSIIFTVIACALLVYLSYQSLTLPLRFPDDYSERMTLEMMAIYLVISAVALVLIHKMPERVLTFLVLAMLAGAFCVQVYIVHEMQVLPEVDLKNIIEQNRALVQNGEHLFTDQSYFSLYTNNIGLAIIVYWVYRIAWLCGIHNCELAGGLFNVCMNMLTYVCAYRIVRRFSNKKASAAFLFFLVTNPVLYAYASYYYTDTVAMGFTMVAVELFLAGIKVDSKKLKTVLLIASGFFMLLAFRVRATSLIIVIAAVVYAVMRGKLWQMIRLGIPFLVGILLASICYSGLYHYHINFDTYETAAPWWHWVAMGTYRGSDGRYDSDIFDALIVQPDHQSKVDVSVQQIKDNLSSMDLREGIDFVLRKEEIVWSRGTKFYFMYVNNVKDHSRIYDWIIGDRSEYFANFMQAYNTVFLLSILVSLLGNLIRRSKLGGGRRY